MSSFLKRSSCLHVGVDVFTFKTPYSTLSAVVFLATAAPTISGQA